MAVTHNFAEQAGINPAHVDLLTATLQAPSAHNTQAWKIRPDTDGSSYEIHFDNHPDMPADPSLKDAYLTMGAFVETMSLQGPNHNLAVDINPELTREGRDLYIAHVSLSELVEGSENDPLSQWISSRHTNRNSYSRQPLTPELSRDLEDLGNTLVDTEDLASVVLDATMESWGDPEYIHDLKTWFRSDNNALDGITPAPFNISKADIVALRMAFHRGGFKSKLMQHFASDRDKKIFTSGPKAAVISVPEVAPNDVFDAGRRLLRSWVTTIASGYDYQPVSVVVDKEEPASQVAAISGVDGVPVAVYRVGKATKPPRGLSNRRPLDQVLI